LQAILVCLIVGSATLGPSALAEKGYYKWMDAKGNPQHSDRPPPAGVEYEYVSTDTGLRRRVSAEESRANEAARNAPGTPTDDDEPTQTAAEDQVLVEKDPALCDQARANFDTLQSKARVRIRDDDGIRYLTEEEKDVQRKRAQDLIAHHCN